MTRISRSNLILGLLCVAFALIVAFVWVPFDSATGLIEKMRGRYQIGDALAPTVASVFLLIGGIGVLVFERRDVSQPTIGRTHLEFMGKILGVLILGVVVMRYAGPLAVGLTNLVAAEPTEYRLLRNTLPWKYIGFVLGGVIIVSGIMSVVERRFTTRALLTGIIAVIILIIVYDVPFEDLLLPPNGDV